MTKRRVLLTGATGFLGGAFLAVNRPQDVDIEWVLPSRGADQADAERRVAKRLARFLPETEVASVLARSEIFLADLTRPASYSDPRLDDVTHVIHLAANTSFIASKGVWEANLEGTRTLAERMRRVPSLKRFLYVGTAMICGDNPAHVVHEDESPSPHVEHLVPYTASKAAAETMLRSDFADLPVVVARPSIVIGDSKLGCGPSGSIFWVVRALERVRLISGEADAGVDVVPADYVARALDHLLFAPHLAHRTYHVSAGAESRTPIRELARRFAELKGEPYDAASYEVIHAEELPKHRMRLTEAFGPGHGRRMQIALGLYLKFCELDVVFDNARLRAEGLPASVSLLDYLRECLEQPAGMDIIAQADDEV
ncbi:MAG: hypothetical protein JWN04_4368 [Myxococcaceae bacterium]|nr:hypothetical protein [Myxococcaceae bacterium]